MNKPIVWFLHLVNLFCFIPSVFSSEMKADGRITTRVQDSTNNLIEMVLEQFLEAGALILIQAKQLIDPNNLGISVALHKHLVNLQQSPLLMAGAALIIIGGPILAYKVFQSQRRRREELQELKNALEENEEEEEYDYEEKFRKLHSSDGEIQNAGEEVEKYKEDQKIIVNSLIDDQKSDNFELETKPIQETEGLAGLSVESIKKREEETNLSKESIEKTDEVTETIEVVNNFPAVATEKPNKKSADFSDENSNDIIEQIKQQFSTPESEFQEVDDFSVIESQYKQPVDTSEVLETFASDLDETNLPNPIITSSENSNENAEEDKELSNLQEEMERTIQEISQQLSEDEGLTSNVPMEPVPSPETTVPIDTKDNETTSALPSDITAEELLKAIGEENNDAMEKLSEEPIAEMAEEDEEYLRDTEQLLQNLKDTTEEKTEPLTKLDPLTIFGPPETSIDSIALDSQSNSKIEEPSPSLTSPKIPKIEPPPRKTVSPIKAKSYLSRLETFQKRLEGRIRNLENDSTIPTLKIPSSSKNFFTLPTRRPTNVKIPTRKTWYIPKEVRQSKKAYSLDVLESLLFLEGQKK